MHNAVCLFVLFLIIKSDSSFKVMEEVTDSPINFGQMSCLREITISVFGCVSQHGNHLLHALCKLLGTPSAPSQKGRTTRTTSFLAGAGTFLSVASCSVSIRASLMICSFFSSSRGNLVLCSWVTFSRIASSCMASRNSYSLEIYSMLKEGILGHVGELLTFTLGPLRR